MAKKSPNVLLENKILELSLSVPHKNDTQIAKELGISAKQVGRIKAKESFKKQLQDSQKTWLDIILEARPKAAKVLIDLLSSEHPNIAIRAAENILQLDKIDTTAHDGEELPPY